LNYYNYVLILLENRENQKNQQCDPKYTVEYYYGFCRKILAEVKSIEIYCAGIECV
jgi:hypothetical protein